MNSHLCLIRNRSTVLTDGQVEAAIPAIQRHVSFDLKAFWNVGAIVHFIAPGYLPPKNAWVFDILDDSDEPGALGYHDLSQDGVPYARVFAKTDMEDGLSWTVTLTHELDELLVDPYVNLAAQTSQVEFYGYEVGDPCEADEFGYRINGVAVTDFVTPHWYSGGTGPYDYAGHCSRPLDVLEGGYASIYRDGAWTQYQNWDGHLTPVKILESRRIRNRGLYAGANL